MKKRFVYNFMWHLIYSPFVVSVVSTVDKSPADSFVSVSVDIADGFFSLSLFSVSAVGNEY